MTKGDVANPEYSLHWRKNPSFYRYI